jgi:hypothetical protein
VLFSLLKRGHRAESGQSLVEFALVLPFVCLLLFGILEMSTAFKYANDLNQSAAAGARMAAVNNWPGKGTVTLTEYVKSQLPGDTAKRGACVASSGKPGDPIEIRATYTGYPLIPLVSDALPLKPPTLNLSGSATMRLEVALTAAGTAC